MNLPKRSGVFSDQSQSTESKNLSSRSRATKSRAAIEMGVERLSPSGHATVFAALDTGAGGRSGYTAPCQPPGRVRSFNKPQACSAVLPAVQTARRGITW